MLPQILGKRARPLTVVENKFVDVLLRGESSEEEMLQHRIMQNDHSRMRERPIVGRTVELVVADVIEHDVRGLAHLHIPVFAKRAEQGFGVIRDAGLCRWERREKTDGQNYSFLRGPNRAVPTRTCVEPSSIAASRSCDMPIDNFGNPCSRASAAKVRK